MIRSRAAVRTVDIGGRKEIPRRRDSSDEREIVRYSFARSSRARYCVRHGRRDFPILSRKRCCPFTFPDETPCAVLRCTGSNRTPSHARGRTSDGERCPIQIFNELVAFESPKIPRDNRLIIAARVGTQKKIYIYITVIETARTDSF